MRDSLGLAVVASTSCRSSTAPASLSCSELRLSIEDLVAFGRFPYSQGRLTQEDREVIDRSIAYMDLEALRHRQISDGNEYRIWTQAPTPLESPTRFKPIPTSFSKKGLPNNKNTWK